MSEQLSPQPVLDQQIPKTPQSIPVWNLVAGIDVTEIRKWATVYRFRNSRLITQVVQVLQQVQPQHDLQWIRLIAALSFVITRLNHGKPFLPWDDPFNLIQKFFFVRTCASSSLNAEIVICLSIFLYYIIFGCSCLFFLCGIAIEKTVGNKHPSDRKF